MGRLVNGERKITNPKPENAGRLLIFCEGTTEYNYLNYFKTVSENIIIGITHLDVKTAYNTSIYRDWEKSQIDTKYPLFFIDAREKNDVLLLI